MQSTSTMPPALFARLSIGAALIAAAHAMIIGALPVFLDDQSQDSRTIGVVVGAYAVTMAGTRLFGGRAVDAIRPPVLLVMAGAMMAVAYIGYLVAAPGLWYLLPRFLHGSAWGLYSITAITWIARTSPANERGKRLGLYSIGTGLALVLMPVVGLEVYRAGNENWLFGLGLVLAVSVMVVAAGRSQLERAPRSDTVERRAGQLFNALVALFLVNATVGLLEAFLPKLAEARSVGTLTVIYASFGIAVGVGRFGGGVVSDKLGRIETALAAAAALVVAFATMQVATGTAAMAGVAVIFGVSVGTSMTTLVAHVSDLTDVARQGHALGYATFLSDIGVAAGAASGGLMASRSPTTVIGGGAVLAAVALLVVWLERQRLARATPDITLDPATMS